MDSFSPGHGCESVGGTQGKRHVSLLKTDANGNVQWHYLFGMQNYRDTLGNPDPDDAYALVGYGWGLVEEAKTNSAAKTGNFLVVGQVDDPAQTFSCGGAEQLSRAFLIEVDQDGQWVSGNFLKPSATAPTNATGIAKYQDSLGVFHYVISGTEFFQGSGTDCNQKVFVERLDPPFSQPPTWEVTDFNSVKNPDFLKKNQNTYDVQIASYATVAGNTYTNHTDILLPAIVDCTNCLSSGFNQGTGMVFRLNPTNGLQVAPVTLPRLLTAFDLRMRVIPTPDGGFAAVSTVLDTSVSTTLPTFPPSCTFDTSTWNTDAYVARFRLDGSLLFDTSFPNVPPTGVNFTVGLTPAETVRTIWPNDYKFKECLYSISQSQDGGFVVSGNNSYNFDDNYMAKLLPELPQPGVNGPDLMIKDTPSDSGIEPNPDTGPTWISEDIWVRNLNDRLTCDSGNNTGNICHQNPVYGQTNYVYVRVTNNSNTPKSGTLHVYWARASTGLSWPSSWINNEIGSGLSVSNVPANGGSMIVEVPWTTVPNPAAFGETQSHVCLLARVLTTDYPAGSLMTYPETTSVGFNTRNNAKIAWKNVTVVIAGMFSPVVSVRNVATEPALIRLALGISKTGPQSLKTFLDYGTIDILLDPDLYQRWVSGGSVGQGVKALPGQVIRLLEPNASISNIQMAPDETKTFSTLISRASLPPDAADVNLDVLQYSTVGRQENLVGGQRFTLPVRAPTGNPPVIVLNPAVANGANLQVFSNPFLIDASRSSDPNGLPLTYSWSASPGANLQPNPATNSSESITFANGSGNYTITLRVTNSAGVSASTSFVLSYMAPAPVVLNVFLQSRPSGSANLSMGVTNSGGTVARNVTVTAITGITATGATFVYNPGMLVIPFVIPGAATLNPGATSGFNLNFGATSGSAGAPFSFVITVKADNAPAFSTTINVPGSPASTVSVAVTPANQQVTSPLAHIDAKATDPSDASATFTYQWTAINAPSVAIINPNSASVDVQLGSFFNTYAFVVKATNTKTGESGTATATVQCICANHF